MAVVIRILSAEIHTFEIVFFRNLFGFIVVSPFFIRLGLDGIKTTKLPHYLLRGVGQTAAQTSFFFGLTMTSMAVAMTLSMTQGLFVAIGAVLILSEPSVAGRWVAVLLGLVGAVMITQPGVTGVDIGAVLVLCSSIGYASVQLNTKVLTRTEPIAAVIAWTLVVSVPTSLVFALFVWTWPTPTQLFWLFTIGLLGTAGSAMAGQAYKIGEMTVIAPVLYVRLIWAGLFGFLLFDEIPGALVWTGASMIVLAGLYMSRSEMRRARANRGAA